MNDTHLQIRDVWFLQACVNQGILPFSHWCPAPTPPLSYSKWACKRLDGPWPVSKTTGQMQGEPAPSPSLQELVIADTTCSCIGRGGGSTWYAL